METPLLSNKSRTSLQTLKLFDSQFEKTSERLATGLKVNRALDGPTAFFTARSLSNRAGDLNRVLDSIGTNLSTVKAAEVGIRALESLVQVAQSIVASAANLPAARPTATGSVDVASQTDLTALAGVSDGDQFSVQVGSGAAVTVTISSGDTPDALLTQLNAIGNVSATFTSSGELQIATTNGEELTLTEVTGTPLAGLGISAGTFELASSISPERASKASQFNAVLTQINQIAGDSSFLGVNLLAGDSPVIRFNEDGTSSLPLSGSLSTATGLGIAQAANGFATDADIAAASADLNAALGSLRDFSSRLSTEFSIASTRQDFTTKLRNVLQSGADGLTLADPNEEGAALLALQTRKSFAQVGFSIVQNSENGVLRLFA